MNLQQAIISRHSVRKYLDREIPAEVAASLQEKIDECNRDGGLNIQLVQDETRAFTGMLSYGRFSGVKNYLAMVGKKSDDLEQRIGYYGEKIVLHAQTLGLNTCWVGLSYRKVPKAYNVDKDEKLCCMIAIGYGENQGVSHKIKAIEQVSNASGTTPIWFRKGVEAALFAPTAVNQQKFFFEYIGTEDERGIVKASKGKSMMGYTNFDLGIAKLHFEIGAGKEIVWKQ